MALIRLGESLLVTWVRDRPSLRWSVLDVSHEDLGISGETIYVLVGHPGSGANFALAWVSRWTPPLGVDSTGGSHGSKASS
jgi:hypothetical protein